MHVNYYIKYYNNITIIVNKFTVTGLMQECKDARLQEMMMML